MLIWNASLYQCSITDNTTHKPNSIYYKFCILERISLEAGKRQATKKWRNNPSAFKREVAGWTDPANNLGNETTWQTLFLFLLYITTDSVNKLASFHHFYHGFASFSTSLHLQDCAFHRTSPWANSRAARGKRTGQGRWLHPPLHGASGWRHIESIFHGRTTCLCIADWVSSCDPRYPLGVPRRESVRSPTRRRTIPSKLYMSVWNWNLLKEKKKKLASLQWTQTGQRGDWECCYLAEWRRMGQGSHCREAVASVLILYSAEL